jgi:hypothetical protein
MRLIDEHDYFTRASEGAEKRASELFAALRGTPAQAIRNFLDDAGLPLKEARLHSGPAGSTLWAVESAAGTSATDAVVDFPPQAIQLARLLAVILNVSRVEGEVSP